MAIRKQVITAGKQGFIYGLGNILNKLASFLLIPVYTLFLPTSVVGILILIELFENLLVNFLPNGVAYGMWEKLKKDPEKKFQSFSSAFYWSLITTSLAILLLYLSSGSFIYFLGIPEDIDWVYKLILLNILFNVQIRVFLWFIQYEGKAIQFIVVSFIQFAGTLLLSILFVVYLGKGLEGFIIGKFFSYLVVFVGCLLYMLFKYPKTIDFYRYISMLRFGFPLMVLGLTHPILTILDRFIMRMLELPLDQIGIYSVGYKFGMIINMILVIPMQRVWSPMMFKLGLKEDSLQYHRDFLLYYSIIGMSLFVGLLLFSREILGAIATVSYDSAASIIPIIALAYFFHGYRIFFQAGAALTGKTWDLILIPMITICVSGIINYLLILQHGVIGAAVATLISYLLLDIIVYIVSGRSFNIEWKWKKLVNLFLLVGIIVYVFFNFILSLDRDVLLFEKLLLLIIFFIGLVVFRIIGLKELNSIKWIVQRISRMNP